MKLLRIALLALLLAVSGLADEKWGDTLRLNIGGMFVTDFQTEMQVSQSGVPIGAKINTKDQLGMQSETAVFWMDGYYRFTEAQSIGFTYYAVKSDSDKYVSGEFQWDGNHTIADAQVQSYFDMTIYELYYGYSFYRNDDVELELTAGLHVMQISLGLSADGTIDGNASSSYESDNSVTAPLPVFGFKGSYFIIPKKLFVTYGAQYFFIEVDQYKGAFVSSALNLSYRFMEHFGAGVGFSANTLAVQSTQGGTTVDITNNLNGITAYLSYYY